MRCPHARPCEVLRQSPEVALTVGIGERSERLRLDHGQTIEQPASANVRARPPVMKRHLPGDAVQSADLNSVHGTKVSAGDE